MHADTLAALLAALRAELAADPAQRGYADQDAAAVTALLNAPIVTQAPPGHRDVLISDVEGYLRARLLVVGLREWAAMAEPSLARSAARELLDIIASPRLSVFLTSQPAGRANILGLFAQLAAVGAGGITAGHLADMEAMTAAPAGPPVTEPPRWAVVIEGIGGVGNEPGPPNAATEALVQEALDGR
jgi:hypothetical protein